MTAADEDRGRAGRADREGASDDAPDGPPGSAPDGPLDAGDLEGLAPDALEKLAAARRRAAEGPRRKRPRGPRPVRELMGGLLEKWGVAESLARARVYQEWADRVGPRISEHAGPVGFDGGTLFVEVESASWLTELRMMKRELIERLNAGRRRGRVEEIVYDQGGGDGSKEHRD